MLFYLHKGVTSYVTSPPGREVRSKLREVLGKSSLIIFTCTIKLEVNIFVRKRREQELIRQDEAQIIFQLYK